MSSRNNPEAAERGGSGFTLIEAIAALTVMAIGLGAMTELTRAILHNVLFAESRFTLIAAAREAYAALPGRSQMMEGASKGAIDGERWRLAVEPYFAPGLPSAAAGWKPERFALQVDGPDGRRIEIVGVQLGRRAPP